MSLIHEYKKNQIKFADGLREIDLKKNKLGNKFIISFITCLKFDSYMKSIDLSHNNFSYEHLKLVIKSGCLNENNSILNVDFRFILGINKKILKHVSL